MEIATMQRTTIALLMLLLLAACGERQNKSPVVDPDILLLEDLQRAGLELERRLMQRMNVQDRVVMIRDPDHGADTYVLPASSLWLLRCGDLGISLVFRTALGED